MIRARRLFLVPALTAFLCLIPVVGVFMWIFVILGWYMKNKEKIHAYFRGYTYEKEEYADGEKLV